MVTLRECYDRARAELASIGIEGASNEAMLLCAHFLGVTDRAYMLVHGDDPVAPESADALECAVRMRASTPLQYILGRWEFDGMALRVRPGVLVPRQDTLTLVDLVSERLEKKDPLILDLCAGTGAVGLSLVRRFPEARCVCVELSDDALGVLEENVAEFGCGRTEILRADVFEFPPILYQADVICSNPPYIPTADVALLEGDVRHEPEMALDGGADGLDFYRAICSMWARCLDTHGILAFEVGIGQAQEVEQIMTSAGFMDIAIKSDYGQIDRAIIGTLVL